MRRHGRRLFARAAAIVSAFATVFAVSAPQAHADTYGFLRNVASGWCADLPNYGAEYYTLVYQYPCAANPYVDNQWWILHDAPTEGFPDPDHPGQWIVPFTIRNAWSEQCMDLPGLDQFVPESSPVGMYDCNRTDADNQLWYWWVDPIYQSGYLKNKKTGLCLDVDGVGGQQNGFPLTVYRCYDPKFTNYGADDHLWS